MTRPWVLFFLGNFRVSLGMVLGEKTPTFWFTDRRRCAKTSLKKSPSLLTLTIGKPTYRKWIPSTRLWGRTICRWRTKLMSSFRMKACSQSTPNHSSYPTLMIPKSKTKVSSSDSASKTHWSPWMASWLNSWATSNFSWLRWRGWGPGTVKWCSQSIYSGRALT